MVYCSSCGTANRDGSHFCNDCGAKLPSGTTVRCPQCGTPNSPADTFCEKCGTRLVPTLADDAPEPEPPAMPLKKGLSLPTKPDADASSTPADWLGQLRSSLDSAAENEPAETSSTEAASASDQSDWQARLTDYAANSGEPASPEDTIVSQPTVAPQSAAEPPATAGEVPDWLTSIGIISGDNPPAADEDVPEWLSQLPPVTANSAENSGAPDASTEPSDPTDWLSNLRATAPVESASSSDEDIPEWLRALGTGPLPPTKPDQPTTPAGSPVGLVRPVSSADSADEEEDIPDWLRTLGTGPLPSAAVEPTLPIAVAPAEPEDATDWLTSLRAAAPAVEPEPIAEVIPAESLPADQSPAPEELPDWLRNLGTVDHTQRSTDELPDWLDSLGTEAATPEASSAEAVTPAEDDVPAWLRDLGASTVTQPAELPQADLSADESSDWMSSLRATAAQPIESVEPTSEPATDEVPDWLQSMGLPTPEQASAPGVDESSDWMNSLRATAAQPAEPTSEPAADEVPDWRQSMGLSIPEQASAPAVDESSDWMNSLRATAAQPIESADPTSEPATDEVPDWRQSMGLPASEPAPAPAVDESSDWMNSLRATAAQPAEPTSEPAAEEVPDWLQSMGLPTSEQAPTPVANESSEWMSSLRATAPQPAEPTSEPAADEVPDWLQSMGLPTPEQAPAPAADETTDWMSSLRATAPQPAEPTSEPAADEVPDWLRSFDEPAARSVVAESPVSPSPADDIPDWLRDVGASAADQPAKTEASGLPDWLQDTSATPEPEPASSAEPVTELPDWLSSLQTPAAAASTVTEPTQPERPAVSPIVAPGPKTLAGGVETPPLDQVAAPAELPEWLKSLREGKTATPVLSVEPLPGLMQAEIPSWLEALRPKEGQAAALADLSAESEQEGVFAGLSNVLPPMPGLDELTAQISHDTTGPTADDLARAGIFQELLTRPISRPTAVAALTTPGRPAQRRLLQWAVAIMLMAVVVAPFVMPQGWLPVLPHADNLPPSPLVQSAVTKITILPPNASVLVVFDYDPTQAGEMNQIAEMLLRHLQTRAANITAVSLNPLGTDLAHSVWDVIGAPTGGQRIDKGYVPGQAIGVQNVLLNNGPFDLVIDLSASSDSLRWWVEQLTVSGFNTPFIAGVSAAVESLALPYAQSGQITGLISGAAGAMMYARQANLLPSLDEAQLVRNQYHIESQTLAHWLLTILIVIGLVSGLVSRVGRRPAS